MSEGKYWTTHEAAKRGDILSPDGNHHSQAWIDGTKAKNNRNQPTSSNHSYRSALISIFAMGGIGMTMLLTNPFDSNNSGSLSTPKDPRKASSMITQWCVTANPSTDIRERATVVSPVVARAPFNSTVTRVQVMQGLHWFKIKYNGVTGYVETSELKPKGSSCQSAQTSNTSIGQRNSLTGYSRSGSTLGSRDLRAVTP